MHKLSLRLPHARVQDAADRGRLTASTFKRLNLGLAAFHGALATVLLTQPGTGPSSLIGLGAAVAAAFFAAQHLLPAKPQAPAK